MTAIANGTRAQPQVIAGTALVRDTFDLLLRRRHTVFYAWLGLLAVSLVGQMVAWNFGLTLAMQRPTAPVILYQVALVLVTGVAHALILRLLSRGDAPGWFRIDGPLIECAGLLSIAQIILTVVSSAGTYVGLKSGDVKVATISSVTSGFLSLILCYVLAKLVLFPIARLEGRGDITIPRAWRLMSRTVRSYIGAWLLMCVPLIAPLLIFAFVSKMDPFTPGAAYIVTSAVLGTLMGLVNQALTLAIYRRRAEVPRDVSAVFD